MSKELSGAIALVTGGSSGIGRAAALALGTRLGSAYCASKHGVVGLTKAAALEYASRGVRINAVAPGIIETELADRAGFLAEGTPIHARVVGMHPMGRLGTPGEVAQAIV